MTINVGRRRMALAPIASSRKQQASTDPRAMVEELPTAHPGQLCSGARGHWCVGFESHEASLVQQLGAAAWRQHSGSLVVAANLSLRVPERSR